MATTVAMRRTKPPLRLGCGRSPLKPAIGPQV